MSTVDLAGRVVGPGEPAFLIAEMSANHDRDLDQALALIDCAAEAGVDAVKLQTYSADSLTLNTDHPSARIDPIWGSANLYELYEKACMPMEFHEPLYQRAREHGLIPFTSVYDERDIDFLEALGNEIYKIASFEMVHLPLLRRVAQTGKPVIISTGMASLSEVDEAVTTLRTNGCDQIVLLHCCSAYPAPVESVNLAAMDTLRAAFNVPVGFSDHTIGAHIPMAAVVRGANVIEKHYTNDPNRGGPDHRFSATPEILADMVRYVRDAEAAIGSPEKGTTEIEAGNKEVGRRSIFASVEIPAGTKIDESMIRVVRPGVGLHPRFYDLVIGREARKTIPAGHPLTWDVV